MEKDELAQEKKVLTAEERRAQIKAEKEKIRKRFQGIDKSLLDVIPADEIPNFFEDTSEKRVCAYNRVSTDNLQQVSSIELQQTTNEQTIREHPGWNLVKIYTDEGISGTSIEHRTGFQEMLRDCEAGLIDVIIVKSVSRFARNLVDCVNIVRKLKYAKHPVGVCCETEHIFSLDGNSEMFLNMMAMLAQSESQNKADVMNDSIEKRFRLGLFLTPPLLGYDRDADGNLVINPDEAMTVKLMYYMILAGSTTKAVAMTLTELGRKTKLGNIKWSGSGIAATLRNERYCGEILARKTYTPNCLDHKSKKNKRNRNQYRMSDHHEPIVTKAQWDAVQKILDSHKYGFEGGYFQLRVIDNGALKGFVSVNRAWAGTGLEEYFTASRKAYGDELPEHLQWYDIPSDEGNEKTEGTAKTESGNCKSVFQVADRNLFSRAGEPSFYLSKSKMRFSSSCKDRFGGTAYIEILLNPIERLIAIRPCEENHPNALRWTNGKNEMRSLGSAGFSRMIYSLMNWLPEYKYHMPAIIRKKDEELIVFFDLDEPIMKQNKNAVVDGNETSDFGIPFALHGKNTRVPLIDNHGEWDIGDCSKTIEGDNSLIAGSADEIISALSGKK